MMAPEDVRRMQQVAYVMAQVAAAYAEIEAMKAHDRTEGQPHTAAQYQSVIDTYGLGHNSVVTTLWEGMW